MTRPSVKIFLKKCGFKISKKIFLAFEISYHYLRFSFQLNQGGRVLGGAARPHQICCGLRGHPLDVDCDGEALLSIVKLSQLLLIEDIKHSRLTSELAIKENGTNEQCDQIKIAKCL